MKNLIILLTVFTLGLFLSSCHRDETDSPQPASATKPPVTSLVSLGSEAWDPMTKHCDRIGRGCKEDVIVCINPQFPAALFAVLDAGQPGNIKSFFNDPANADCLPAQLKGDPAFMALVNEERMYSQFYTEASNPQRRIYLFGEHANLTITDNLLIVPITYQ